MSGSINVSLVLNAGAGLEKGGNPGGIFPGGGGRRRRTVVGRAWRSRVDCVSHDWAVGR